MELGTHLAYPAGKNKENGCYGEPNMAHERQAQYYVHYAGFPEVRYIYSLAA